MASKPEAAPVRGGVEVTPSLVRLLQDLDAREAAALVLERDAFGRQKYGQPLMSGDGRDDLEDLLQEIGDALQYAWKAKINGVDVSRARRLVGVLAGLMALEAHVLADYLPAKDASK